MPSVDLDSPEHAICSAALAHAREANKELSGHLRYARERADKAEAEVERLRAELNAWRETFEKQTQEQRSQRSYAECYAIGTRALLRSTSATKVEP